MLSDAYIPMARTPIPGWVFGDHGATDDNPAQKGAADDRRVSQCVSVKAADQERCGDLVTKERTAIMKGGATKHPSP